MKNIPLTVFFVLVIITGSIAAYMLWNVPQRFTPQNELIGENLVDVFSTTQVEEIRIADEDSEVILSKDNGNWVVDNRQDYPVDEVAEINELVESILLLRVGLEIPAEPQHYAEMGLLAPAEEEKAEAYLEKRREEGEDNPEDPRGLRITMKGAGDKTFADLVLGEEFGNTPGERYRGMVLRSLAGNEGVWKVLGTLNRRTGEAASGGEVRRGEISEPKAWLEYDFLEVEKIQSISLSAPNDDEFEAWTVSRDTENGDFTLPDLDEDMEMDTSATNGFKKLFSKMRFEDVLEPTEAEKRQNAEGARNAVIKTFEGFTYTLNFAPLETEEANEDEDSPPPPSSNYVGTIQVEGTFSETREKGADETPENAKALDETHSAKLELLKSKLEKAKSYEGTTYEFAQFVISSLNKTRDELVKEKAPPSPDDDNAQTVPGRRPSAVSPPIRVPPVSPQNNR